VPSGLARSIQPAKQLRQTDLQNVRDLAGRVDGDVDPAAFEQAHVGAVKIAGFGEGLLRVPARRADLAHPRP
jgi:hypothetical protein